MKKSNLINITLILCFSLFSLWTIGCSPKHEHNSGEMYCDDSGCFQCSYEGECWRTQACSADEECPDGFTCTEVGCMLECELSGECLSPIYHLDDPDPINIPDPSPKNCEDDEGCDVDHFCDEGVCTPRCQSDDDCGSDMLCSSCGKCQPKGIPATCGASQIFCTEGISCGPGKTCLNNRCHYECADSSTCGVGQICSEGLCIDDPAPATPECILNYDCQNGTCINGFCHAQCEQSFQCGSESLCIMSVCQADYNPVQ